jgi:hypothetical protein
MVYPLHIVGDKDFGLHFLFSSLGVGMKIKCLDYDFGLKFW